MYFPMYEAKMFRPYDHRFGSVFENSSNWVNQGQTHEVLKSTIEESRLQSTSMMPDEMYKRLTDTEFVDLLEFLLSLTKVPSAMVRSHELAAGKRQATNSAAS